MLDGRDLVVLISGYHDLANGGLFSYDGSELAVIDRISCTGLSVSDGQVGRLLRATEEFDSIAELLVYDEVGVSEYLRLDTVRDPHDLRKLEDGSWLIVSSSDNAVLRLTGGRVAEPIWQPTTVPDSWHPNCLEILDGEVWVTAFGPFDESRGWSGDAGYGSGILTNISTGATLGGLSHPHSPRFADGSWWVCNSLEQTLVRWDAEHDRWERRFELNGYTRGLAVDGDTIYVGESANRGRDDELASLVVAEGDVVRERIPLPCAEIFDVELAPASLVKGLRRAFDTNPHRVVGGGSGIMHGLGEEGVLDGLGKILDPSSAGSRIWFEPFKTIRPGEQRRVQAVVKNVGTAAVASVSPYPVNLSYRWTDGSGARIDGERTRLRRTLIPGEAAPYELDLWAPEERGTYLLTVSLVQEGNCWFDELAPDNGVNLEVVVAD